MIGQKKILHDPHANPNIPRGTREQLMSHVRPGDVFVYADPETSVFRAGAQATGSDIFHTMPIVSGRGANAKNIIAGEFDGKPELQAKMQKAGPEVIRGKLDSLKKSFSAGGDPDGILLRPKVPLTPAQEKAFAEQAMLRGAQKYSPKKAIGNFLHELLMPKLFRGNGQPSPLSEGEMCSTLVGESMAGAGRHVVDNKPASRLMPVDFLRSDQYEPVMARVRNAAPTRLAKAMPYLARAGIGAGLAGVTYAASEDPAAAAVPAGMLAGSALGNAAAKHFTGHGAPSALGVLSRVGSTEGAARRQLLARYGATRGLGMALGGGAAYLGVRALQNHFGEKTSAEENPEESHLGRNLAVGAAAASPFAGMIGQGKVLHDPHLDASIPRHRNLEELGEIAQPGDVLMTTKPKGSFWKKFIQPVTGSDFYHVQPIVDYSGGEGRTIDNNEFRDPSYRKKPNDFIRTELNTLPDLHDREDYKDMFLLRPNKPLSPAEVDTFRNEAITRGRNHYDSPGAIKSYLRDLFVPKVGGPDTTVRPACKGDICSTTPAQALAATGRHVVPGKAPHQVFPADYLRSDQFHPVGAYVTHGGPSSRYRRLAPLMLRAGMGAGLGGATYAVSGDPALAAAPLGVAAGAHAVHKLFGDKAQHALDLVADIRDVGGSAGSRAKRQLAAKGLGGLAGGALAYYGAKTLKDKIQEKTSAAGTPQPQQPMAQPQPQPQPQQPWYHRPGVLAAGAAAVALPTAYALARRRTFSDNPAMRAVQEASKGQFTRVIGHERPDSVFARWSDRLIHAGGGKVLYTGGAVPAAQQHVPGVVRHFGPRGAKAFSGDVNVGLNQDMPTLVGAGRDKMKEYNFFNEHAPGSMSPSESLSDVLKTLGYASVPKGPKARARMFDELQTHLKGKYDKGFLLKDTNGVQSGGFFPDETDNFNSLLTRYRNSGLAQKTKEMRRAANGDSNKLNDMMEKLRNTGDGAYSGRVLHKAVRDPSKVMVQEKIQRAPGGNREYRVHVENGQVLPSLVSTRFLEPGSILNRKEQLEAARHAQEWVNKLPGKYRQGTFGMDVMPSADNGFKLVESNPSGRSGLLGLLPHSGVVLHKHYTGQHGVPVAAGMAAAGAAGAGLAAGGAGAAYNHMTAKEETPPRRP